MRHSGGDRVVISGIGVVSPFGVGRERFWHHVSRGCSGTRAITDFDASDFACRVAAPVTGVTIDDVPALDGDDIWDVDYRADPKRYSRAALIGVIAAREAWPDAHLRIAEPGAGVVIGSGGGGIDVGERQYYDFFVEHGRKVTPYAIPISIVGMMSSEISISLRLRHQPRALVRLHELDRRDRLRGRADSIRRSGRAAVGRRRRVRDAGDDVRLLAHARRLDRVQRPRRRRGRSTAGRDGFVLGEGAWMVVLEREDRARARGATIYASIDGYASTCDAYHRVQMAPDGRGDRARHHAGHRALGPAPGTIGYVNYHGTSTVLNDAVESRCVRRVFGAHADGLPGSSVKSMIGHPQGASGAAGVVTSALAMSRGFLPPTINQSDPDPACDLDFVPNRGRPAEIEAALCNCLGFGSKNSALVIGAVR